MVSPSEVIKDIPLFAFCRALGFVCDMVVSSNLGISSEVKVIEVLDRQYQNISADAYTIPYIVKRGYIFLCLFGQA